MMHSNPERSAVSSAIRHAEQTRRHGRTRPVVRRTGGLTLALLSTTGVLATFVSAPAAQARPIDGFGWPIRHCPRGFVWDGEMCVPDVPPDPPVECPPLTHHVTDYACADDHTVTTTLSTSWAGNDD